MPRTVLARGLLAALLAACAVVLSVWGGIPWVGLSALALLGGCIVGLVFTQEKRVGAFSPRALAIAWVCTLMVPASLLLAKNQTYTLDTYYALVAWLMAGALWAGAVGRRLTKEQIAEAEKLAINFKPAKATALGYGHDYDVFRE